MSFLNRTDELGLLTERLQGTRAEFLVVYGRRRVGKTELLNHLAKGCRSLYFEAPDSVVADQLRDLTDELNRVCDNPVLASQPLDNWRSALGAIAQLVGTRRTLVILDEFQLLAGQAPELESLISRWWRTTGRDLPLMLVLAGSELSFFENEVLAGRLYGRRTGQLRLEPFTAHDSALFHPGYAADDRVRTFAVCGGIPYYLDQFRDDMPLADHLLRRVLYPTGLLHQEAELMLRQSIADPVNHMAVLRSIAHGHNRNNAISQRTRLAPAHVTKLLDTLERLGLVERIRPVTASTRARKISYAIRDHFLRFHFRFVETARSQLRTRQLAERYLNDAVLPQLDEFVSLTWEDICREQVLHTVEGISEVGRWWGQVPTGDGRRTEEREIDVVGVDVHRRPVVVGMCKWTEREVDFDELNLLDRLTPHIEGATSEIREVPLMRFLFSRSGFSARLVEFARHEPALTLVTPADIYR